MKRSDIEKMCRLILKGYRLGNYTPQSNIEALTNYCISVSNQAYSKALEFSKTANYKTLLDKMDEVKGRFGVSITVCVMKKKYVHNNIFLLGLGIVRKGYTIERVSLDISEYIIDWAWKNYYKGLCRGFEILEKERRVGKL